MTHGELGAVVDVELPQPVPEHHVDPPVAEGAAPEPCSCDPLVSEHLHQPVTHAHVLLTSHHEQLLSDLVGEPEVADVRVLQSLTF